MKVFISWSGDLSHRLGTTLRDWLPSVVQSIDPYVSSEDIDKGARWSTDLAGELEACDYGILCVTRENIGAPWLNFEAGALSKSVDQSRVSPFLLNLKRSEIQGPLLQFQSTIGESEDVRKLVQSLNRAGDAPLDEARLDSVFDVWWPHLDGHLRTLASDRPARGKPTEEPDSLPAQTDILEEIWSSSGSSRSY